MANFLDLEPIYHQYWHKLQTIINNHRLAQSLLFVGTASSQIDLLIRRLMAALLCCKGENEPCLECPDCLMSLQNEHPDLLLIQPEKAGTAIKIEQIRTLQTEIYQTTQRGNCRFILIKSAENMNKASANALLKILEEPPEHCRFILIATHLATLPATILSRCQLWRINSTDNSDYANLLGLNNDVEHGELVLQDLLSLMNRETIPTLVAENWKSIPLSSLLQLLYLIYAQMLMPEFIKGGMQGKNTVQEIYKKIKPQKIFHQLDKINTLQKKLSHNIHVNAVLAMEDLLMDLCQGAIYV